MAMGGSEPIGASESTTDASPRYQAHSTHVSARPRTRAMMPTINEHQNESNKATAQPTAQENPVQKDPQTENPAPTFPPEGFMVGHIYVRARSNPDRFTILGSNDRFYTYRGKPNEGEQLNRLAPVIFRPSLCDRDATEVSETKTPSEAAHGAFQLRGKITSVHEYGGELTVARKDDRQGPYDKTPTKFFLKNLENRNQKIPKVGTHVLFKTDFARSFRAHKGGGIIATQRYVNITHITQDTHALRTNDKEVANPELLKLLVEKLNINVMVGTQPSHESYISHTALQATQMDSEGLPEIIHHMNNSAREHCFKHASVPTTPPSPPSTVEAEVLVPLVGVGQTHACRHHLHDYVANPPWVAHRTSSGLDGAGERERRFFTLDPLKSVHVIQVNHLL